MRVRVEGIVSAREFGIIFSAVVTEGGNLRKGEALKVRAGSYAILGEPVPGEIWQVEGDILDTKWGPQLEAKSAFRILPTGILIQKYIADHVPGIGTERANRLWKAFGTNIANVLCHTDNIALVAHVIAPERPNLALRLSAAVIRSWKEAVNETRLIDWLTRHGIEDIALALRIDRILGSDAVERLRANPYILVPLLPWAKVDSLGLRLLAEVGSTKPHEDPRRLVGSVDASVKMAIGNGHTAMDAGSLHASISRLLGVSNESKRVRDAVSIGERHGAVVRSGEVFRAPGCAAMEETVRAHLRSMLMPDYPRHVQVPSRPDLERLLCNLEDKSHPMHPEQREAVLQIVDRTVFCLQGGAGVGKTFTTRMVCDLWEALAGNVLLCSLAGKAALRLSRSTGRVARTLARTMGELRERKEIEEELSGIDLDMSRRGMLEHRLSTLADIDGKTLVIVDEASMVDLPTMHALLRRMPPGARLLLVGDEAQLPPVGFGLIYHRLVEDNGLTSRLTTVHRQAEETGIPVASASIRRREAPIFHPYCGRGSGVSFVDASTPQTLAQTVERIAIELGGHDKGVLVVTATNEGDAGIKALNRRFHDLHIQNTGFPAVKGHLGQWFSCGEPVIYLRNDYRRGLFNGLLGQVRHVDLDTRTCEVLFDGFDKPHRLESIDLIDLALAHAITCHKAQGSQAPRVIVPLYESRVLDPCWLYTAITRAERQVVLVGSRKVLFEALKRPPAFEKRLGGFYWVNNNSPTVKRDGHT